MRLLKFITDHPLLVLLGVAVLTLLAALQVADPLERRLRIEIDPSIDSLLPEWDPDREHYEYVRRLFGSDETILIALTAEDVFAEATLERIQRLTKRLEREPDIHHVLSLANAIDLRTTDDSIELAPFLEALPRNTEERNALRRAVMANPLYAGKLVARDGRVTLLLVHLKDRPERELLERDVVGAIDRAVREIVGDDEVHVTGGLYTKAENARLMLADLGETLPLAVFLVCLVAAISFRSARGVIVPAASVSIAVVWTLGIMAAAGSALNLMSIILPTLILVVGFAYSVHAVSEYYHVMEHDPGGRKDRRTVAQIALERVALPLLLAGVTTAAGFISLVTSRIEAIRQFGLYSALGISLAVLCTLTFTPAVLALMPERTRRKREDEVRRFDGVLTWLAHFDLRHRGVILGVGAAVAIVAVYAATRIDVSTHFVEPGGALHRASLLLDRHMEGSNSFYVVLASPEKGAFEAPENLRTLRGLQRWLVEQPEIGGASSLADYVMLLNRSFLPDDPDAFDIPDSRRLISQLLFFGASDELERLVDSQRKTAVIEVRSRVSDSASMAKLLERIEERMGALPDNLAGRVTGNTVLLTRTLDDLARGQVVSLGAAFTMILIVLSLLFTSLRTGAVALLPNALPVLLYFGILGSTGVTLNTTTGLVACLVLGIAVDDTIHYLARFNSAAKRWADETRAIRDALFSVGRPITYTSIALCLGFLALTTSRFQNQVEFGALAAATLGFAWLVDVTFTPAIASRMRIVSLWDVLTLDLGEAPSNSIPLFRGLSVYQARIAALMFSLVEFGAGERLFSAGDEGHEMYVVIRGRLRAFLETESGVVTFAELERGDAFGDVALFHGKRTASVVAETDAYLMRFTRNDLERLARRHPRTANRLYANLSELLADHVASTTQHVR